MYSVYLDKQPIHDLNSEENVLVSPTLNLELNKAGTFEFSMECTHPYYDKLERFKSIVQVLCDGDEIFKGRIIEITDDMYKTRKVYCESELAYLNDTIQRPAEYHLAASAVYEYLQAVIGSHNSQVGDYDDYKNSPESVPKWLELGMVTVNDPNDYIYCYTNYNSTMDEIKEDLVDDLGGYIRIRNEYKNNDPLGTLTGRYIDYINLEEYGKTGEQRIEFGENLLDFSNDINQADICTGIIPLGATLEESEYSAIDERVTIESVNSGSDYITIPEAVEKYGLILKVVTWDDITEPKNLLSAAKNYLAEYDYEPQTITATAVDMHLTDEEIESWRLGDKIFVESEPHDLHKRFPLAQMSIPLDQPENTSVTLGTYEDTSLSGRTNRTEQGLRNFENFEIGNVIASAVAQASALIKARTYGYVTIHYDEERDCADEILIMDAPNTDDATRVWRWNLNGLGYSKTGYDGDYGLAMTMDGRILGNFITACGMVLANDSDANFGKFDNTGMKIYKQTGREDLLLMTVGQLGMMLFNENGSGILASFDSDAVTFYNKAPLTTTTETRSVGVSWGLDYTCTFYRYAVSIYNVSVVPNRDVEENIDYIVDYGINANGYSYVKITNLQPSGSASIQFSITCTTTYYTSSSMTKNMQLDGDGLRVYDTSGNLRSNLDYNSFDVYDADENMLMTVDANGLRMFDADGDYRVWISRTNFNIYDSTGLRRAYLGTDGLYYYDSNGDYRTYMNTNGVTYYEDGAYVGRVGQSHWYQRESERGMHLYITHESAFLSFSWKKYEDAEYSTAMLYVFTSNSSQGEEGIHFSTNAFLAGWEFHLGSSSSTPYFQSANDGSDGAFYGGDFYFNDGNLYYKRYEVATKNDIAGLSLLANGEEAEGDFSLYSGLHLDISELVNYKSSDEMLKTAIQPLNDARVDNITPVTFKWRGGDDTAHYGYIAQEVREHIPEIVKENDDGLLSLAYTEIIPLLHAKINTLEDRIAKLEEIIYGEKK